MQHRHLLPADDVLEHLVDLEGVCPCRPRVEPFTVAYGPYGYVYVHQVDLTEPEPPSRQGP